MNTGTLRRGSVIIIIGIIGALAPVGPPGASAQQKTVDQEITEAVSPLPEPLRAGATVKAYRGPYQLETIRQGDNMMICLADDPSDDRFHTACYHEDLEPFMARGRELRRNGITARPEIDRIRREEIESGALAMPREPRALYSLFGDPAAFDYETGELEGARGLYVLYMPFATEQSTGISTVSSRDRPWLMFPGTPWAHIMIAR